MILEGQLELFAPGWAPGHVLVRFVDEMRYDVDGMPRLLTWEKWFCSCGDRACTSARMAETVGAYRPAEVNP